MQRLPGTEDILIFSHHYLNFPLEHILELLPRVLVTDRFMFRLGVDRYSKRLKVLVSCLRRKGFVGICFGPLFIVFIRLLARTPFFLCQKNSRVDLKGP